MITTTNDQALAGPAAILDWLRHSHVRGPGHAGLALLGPTLATRNGRSAGGARDPIWEPDATHGPILTRTSAIPALLADAHEHLMRTRLDARS
jgi:hypothetical protein